MAYTVTQKVLFKHCDPAGIVFYPRYFEMVNDTVEAFFGEVVGVSFEDMHRTHSVPTAAIEAQFHAPSRHGDILTLALTLERLGRSSLGYRMRASCGESLRFTSQATLVYVDAQGRPEPWPSEMRARIGTIMEAQA